MVFDVLEFFYSKENGLVDRNKYDDEEKFKFLIGLNEEKYLEIDNLKMFIEFVEKNFVFEKDLEIFG